MYHLELRKFPHTACRFNQSEEQLRAVVVPWARQEWVEEGERSWNINEAGLTVIEGPQLSMPDLAMGRGWRNAQKRGQDVTERVLAAARELGAQGSAPQVAAPRPPEDRSESASANATLPAPGGGAREGVGGLAVGEAGDAERRLLADSLGLEVLALLDRGSLAPFDVWRAARERVGERGGGGSGLAAESLALAALALRALLQRGLVVLRLGGAESEDLAGEQSEALLGAIETWAQGQQQPVLLARKV